MAVKIRRGNNKNPPILSHEFIIQNHADIVACIAMLFVVGLIFQVQKINLQNIFNYLYYQPYGVKGMLTFVFFLCNFS